MSTTTASTRRAKAKLAYDAFLARCPSRRLLDRISDKWVTLVLCALAGGEMRYSEIGRRIAGVSPKMLTQTLRVLERDGLLVRSVEATVPVTVTYSLTPLGHSLVERIVLLKGWAEEHIEQIDAAQEAYDLAAAARPTTGRV